MKRRGAKAKGARKRKPGAAKAGPARLGIARRLRNYFFAGILVAAPVGITFWLTWKVIAFIDDQITPFIPPRWTPEHYLPFALPGFGLLVAAIILTLIGVLAAGFLGRLIKQFVERVVTNVPVARDHEVTVLGRVGPAISGKNAFGGTVTSVSMDAIAVMDRTAGLIGRVAGSDEIYDEWKSGELFAPE